VVLEVFMPMSPHPPDFSQKGIGLVFYCPLASKFVWKDLFFFFEESKKGYIIIEKKNRENN